jgi:hypothetical protein
MGFNSGTTYACRRTISLCLFLLTRPNPRHAVEEREPIDGGSSFEKTGSKVDKLCSDFRAEQVTASGFSEKLPAWDRMAPSI